MNIWLITIGEILPIKEDTRKGRTAFLAEKLAERGHNVLWWTSAFDHYRKRWIFKKDTTFNLNKNLKIKALKGLGYKKNFSLKRYLDHRVIALKFKKLALQESKPDIIITSMPNHDLAYRAITFAKKNRIPAIVDIRDMWPDIFFDYFPRWAHKIAKVFLYKDFQMVNYCFKNATHIVAMMESVLNWALAKAKRKKTLNDKIFYLGAKKVGKIPITERLSFAEELTRNKFVVTFIGAFNETYNPLILTKAAEILSGLNIHFILGGDGIYFPKVKEASKELKNLTLTGWLSDAEINSILSLSNIGIISTAKKVVAFPNKAFTYLSAGLPIISSVEGDLKELIQKYNIGFYYPPNDLNFLVKYIKQLYKDKNLYEKMSRNTNEIFNKFLDSDKIYTEYAEYIERLALSYKWNRENK